MFNLRPLVSCLFVLAVLYGCRQHHAIFDKDTLLLFNTTTSTLFCDDSISSRRSCNSGTIFLSKEGKVLYYADCDMRDTLVFFRGTYRVSDSLISCVFDSQLDLPSSGQEEGKKYKFFAIRRKTFVLKKTTCNAVPYVLYHSELINKSNNLTNAETVIFRVASAPERVRFCESSGSLSMLRDFHCRDVEKPNTSAVKQDETEHEGVNLLIAYYSSKFAGSKIQRLENDSMVVLELYHQKQGRITETSPFLFVRIFKSRNAFLYGDMNNDMVSDLLAKPILSEGGETYWQELFIMVREDGQYKVKLVASNMDIARCPKDAYNGAFIAERISEGVIYGSTECFTDDDEQCCPSVIQPAAFVFKDDQLHLMDDEQ